MQYTIKSGVLYNEAQTALAKIKSALLGPQRKIFSITNETLLTADIRYLDESKASSGDVRNREFSRLFRTLSVKLCYGITANFTPFSTVSLDGN